LRPDENKKLRTLEDWKKGCSSQITSGLAGRKKCIEGGGGRKVRGNEKGRRFKK